MARHSARLVSTFLLRLFAVLLLVGATQGVLTPMARAQQGIAPDLPIESGPENTLGNKSDTDIWRALRGGLKALPSGSDEKPEAGVLITGSAPPWEASARSDWWTLLRRADGPLVRYGGIGLAGVLGILLLFFVIRGPIGYGKDTGQEILRFRLSQRVTHWVIAAIFTLMAITGMLLMFGRPYIAPYIGKTAYSVIATASMQAHNLFGPIFGVMLVALFLLFLRGNFPKLHDIWWILKGGGFFGGHARAGRYNFGEKLWFWTAIIAGGFLVFTGVHLLFPDYFASRAEMRQSEVIHAIAAMIFIGYALGHIYLGTIGTKGSLKGMVDGKVDENWAKAHHDIWLEKELAKKEPAE